MVPGPKPKERNSRFDLAAVSRTSGNGHYPEMSVLLARLYTSAALRKQPGDPGKDKKKSLSVAKTTEIFQEKPINDKYWGEEVR
jgi:hypothetical protein